MAWGKDNELWCDGWCDRLNDVTMIDLSGYIYCTPCGERRRWGCLPTRKLSEKELGLLHEGRPVPSFWKGV